MRRVPILDYTHDPQMPRDGRHLGFRRPAETTVREAFLVRTVSKRIRLRLQQKREFAMLRLFTGAVALVIVTLPATAQTTAPGAGTQTTVPSGQNSGAGIPGKPGSKSGPAAKSSSETTGSDMSDHNRAVRQQDSSKIPGQPGNKSGPAVKPPERNRFDIFRRQSGEG
jgi:hypothetical protein